MGGSYLTKPITNKETTSGGFAGIEYAMSCMQGWRQSMEDAHICSPQFDTDTQLYAVFDGHGGFEAALFAEKHFPIELKNNKAYQEKDFKTALEQTFLRIDELLRTEEGKADIQRILKTRNPEKTGDGESNAGCTANVTLIHKGVIYVANAGDSRCVLSNDGKSEDLSKDHKPDDPIEFNRITKANGKVTNGRVNGNLNLSRALGDLSFKANTELKPEEQLISAFPDIVKREITPKDEFLLIGCDGIWELKTNQELITICRNGLASHTPMTKIVEDLLDQIIAKDSSQGLGCDNMSMILVKIKRSIYSNDAEPDKESLLANGVLDKYKAAGLIADSVVEELISKLKPQQDIAELCALGDELVAQKVSLVYLKDKHKGLAVPTTITLNEQISNNAPLKSFGKKEVIKKGDLVKVSVGVQIDGFISESAQTTVVSEGTAVDGRKADVIHAAYSALQVALRTLNPENCNLDTAGVIKKAAGVYNCTPVIDARSYEIKKNALETSFFIPSPLDVETNSYNAYRFEQYEVYTLNIVVSTGKGKPVSQANQSTPSILKRVKGKHLSQIGIKKNVSQIFDQIEEQHQHFPFSFRAFSEDPIAEKAIQEFVKQGVLSHKTVESEAKGEYVACFKQTVAIYAGGLTLLSGLKLGEQALDGFKSAFSISSVPELKELMDKDVIKKKKNKSKKK